MSQSDLQSQVRQQRYLVGVCTAERPRMLKRCLDSLVRQDPPADGIFSVLVVENDAEPKSRAVVEEVSKASGVQIHYVQESRRGIPVARNKVLDEAEARDFDWIASVDDDCVADTDWLARLGAARTEFNADCVRGPVRRNYETGLPSWCPPKLPNTHSRGKILAEHGTNNSLFSRSIFASDGMGLRFDERLLFGGEDVDFISRAVKNGARTVWVDDAWLEEEIPSSRLISRRLLQRRQSFVASHSYRTMLHDGLFKAWLNFGVKGIRRVIRGRVIATIGLAIMPFQETRGRHIYYSGLYVAAMGLGHLQDLFAKSPDYYSKIDGN